MRFVGSLALTTVLLATTLGSATAQESVFNLPSFGLPGTGQSMRARGLGGAAAGLANEVFSVDNPAYAARFDRAGFYAALLGHEAELDTGEVQHTFDDVVFPMGQAVFPALYGSVLSVGFSQFVDFDAALESTVVFESDTLPATFDSEGGLFVVSPTLSYTIDEQTSVGLSLDIYLGSREIVRSVDTPDRVGVVSTTSDSLTRDFRAQGVAFGVHRLLGSRGEIGFAYRLRPSVESEINQSSGGTLDGQRTHFDLPNSWVLDGSYRVSEEVRAAAVLRGSQWRDFKIDDVEAPDQENEIVFGVGVEYTPRQTTAVVVGPDAPLRAGMRWKRLPVRVEDETVSEWAATLGYSRRFGARSRIDLLFEFGRQGSIESNGLRETFVRLGVGIGLFERWRRRTS